MVEEKTDNEYNLVDFKEVVGKVIQKKDGTIVTEAQLLIEIANTLDRINKRL